MNGKAYGDIGEETAAKYLAEKGYEILERNAEYCGAEVDIIAKNRGTYVFCEVKTRSDNRFGRPAEAVTPAKMSRYVTAAKGFIVLRRVPNADIRFDVIEIEDGLINHIEGAFDCSDAAKYRRRKY